MRFKVKNYQTDTFIAYYDFEVNILEHNRQGYKCNFTVFMNNKFYANETVYSNNEINVYDVFKSFLENKYKDDDFVSITKQKNSI